jgi:hypothetical protein
MRDLPITVKTSGKKRLPLQQARSLELKPRRRFRHAKAVHALGRRTTAECFDKIAREFDEQFVDHVLEKFAKLDPALLKALDVDALPLTPIRVVARR